MAEKIWKTFEELVRATAALVFGKECTPQRIAGINFDGVIEINNLETAIIEISEQNDLDKVRQGIGRLGLARQQLSSEGILARGYIILSRDPTQAMIEAADTARVTVASASQFAALFFEFARYKSARNNSAFGSSIDPLTGEIDKTTYVPVSYIDISGNSELSVRDISDHLLEGGNIILLGEYGSGKSRCVREIFSDLSERWDLTFNFPYAINLRDCWGLERADELIRRGVFTLGLDDLAPSAVRAFNRNSLIFLLDGFDEIGSQAWSTDEARLRQLRARALIGVKDLITKTSSGCLVAGREHYFSSNEEMVSTLGLFNKNTKIVKAKDQFSDEELEKYFDAAGIYVELPSWLPRKPLICQTIAQLSDDEVGKMFGIDGKEVAFWSHFIKVVCERDARINAFFDPETIYQVFVSLSRITRNKPSMMGPISQRELQEAFESVVGELPVEDASVMLQRLPSLGRIGAESQDRQFVDMFILDGLRAKDVSRIIDSDESSRRTVFESSWSNPLQNLGQSILAEDIKSRSSNFVQLASRASRSSNSTLAADIVSSFLKSNFDKPIDLQNIVINGSSIGELDLRSGNIYNLNIEESTIEYLILPNSPPKSVKITRCMAGKVAGAASFSGLPQWVQLETVDSFDSVQTVAQIRKAGLSPAHEVLVAILKKIFLQKGAGRKEEALLRGFGAGASRGIADKVLNLLMRENVIDRHKGDDGWVYFPIRSHAARVGTILDQLRSAQDDLWEKVDRINR